MSFLTRLLADATTPSANPLDERFWLTSPAATASGRPVTPESALMLSVIWRCVQLLSETIAGLPLVVYETVSDGQRKAAYNHPLYDLLHDRPNEQQTAIEFRQMMTTHAIMRGNGYAEMIGGDRGKVDQLKPLHPDLVKPEPMADGSLRYKVRRPDNTTDILLDDQVLHLKGLSLDGRMGVSVITYARESMGLSMAAERYGANYFRNDASPGGVLQATKTLSDGAVKRMKESWDDLHRGDGAHSVAILEEGTEWKSVGLTNRDSQFLELRNFQASDGCRWFGVPPHMVGLTGDVTSWGSGIEQLGIAFVTYTLLPWLKRWEQAISRDLIIAPQRYFVEHVVAGLLRGDTKSRYDAYAVGRMNGWLSTNEVRRMENLNPIPGGDDDYLMPLNMQRANAATAAPAQPTSDQGRAQLLTQDAAARTVRREIAVLEKAARRFEGDAQAWTDAVNQFYGEHVDYVVQALHIPPQVARVYATGGQRELLAGGAAVMADWTERRVAELAGLANNWEAK